MHSIIYIYHITRILAYIYRNILLILAGITWGNFTECSQSCDGGTRQRVSSAGWIQDIPCNSQNCVQRL